MNAPVGLHVFQNQRLVFYADILTRPVGINPKGLFRPDATASEWRRKHNALELEHMFVNLSIQTGRVASKKLYNRDAVDLCWRVRSE